MEDVVGERLRMEEREGEKSGVKKGGVDKL